MGVGFGARDGGGGEFGGITVGFGRMGGWGVCVRSGLNPRQTDMYGVVGRYLVKEAVKAADVVEAGEAGE